MAAMTKRVNVKALVPVRNITPPIYGTCNNVVLSVGDILKCICRRAIVEEILPSGKTVRLNMSNYNTDNGAGLDAKLADKAPIATSGYVAPIIETPVEEPEVVTTTNVEETEDYTPVEEVAAVVETVEETAEETPEVEDDAVVEDSTEAGVEEAVANTEEAAIVETTEEAVEEAKDDATVEEPEVVEEVKEEKKEEAPKKAPAKKNTSNSTKKKNTNNSKK